MIAVQLTTVVLNDAEDPADVLVLTRLNSYNRRPSKPGRRERVAGGGSRLILDAAEDQTWPITVTKADRATVDWIEAHVGRIVTVRDDAGHKMHAFYLAPDIEEVPYPRTASFDLELTSVTWTEAL